jgi:signal transduction histidine kinase
MQNIVLKNKDDNKAKDDLISMTLHHIRTPLTGMMWSTKELSFETPADNPQKNRIEKLNEETVRILHTVEKLIQTSRENNGRSSYCFEIYSMEKLERLISESVAKMRPAAYAKDLSVEMETAPLSNKVVKIDNDKIITVVQTLFENAIHYTKSGGGIKIRMEEKGSDFFFYITDTGIGIPINEQSKIFSQFYRSTNAKLTRSEGLGIGLFLAKSFVDAHNGGITFNSSSHGTTFIMRLPTVDPSDQTSPKRGDALPVEPGAIKGNNPQPQ